MAANFETGMFVRVPAWHGLGIVIDDAPNSHDAIVAAGLDWEVHQKPATFEVNGKTYDTGYITNYRSTDHSVLGLVTKQFHPVQNAEAFEFTDNLIGTGNVRYNTAGSLDKGKLVWMLAELPEQSILGDKIVPYLLVSNAHDGKHAMRVTMTPTRVVCQNTLNYALDNAARIWSYTHTGDITAKIAEAQRTLANAETYMNALAKDAEKKATQKISNEDVQKLMNILFPLDEDKYTQRKMINQAYLREMFQRALQADDLQNFTGTAWGVINAASDFVHATPLRETTDRQASILKSFINGNAIVDTTARFLDSIAA